LNDKNKEEKLENHQPEILDVEIKEITEQKPPNDKIVYYNLKNNNKKVK
jgi:hypothetical protein